ncbi:hypothetical protein F0L74_21510 [Chitinophaga agrisoli]|uniref:Uncharacterized protein n=1 Tax=Chitinophaga agrisoli TaxID=2607653 RepID=A0A5B2VIP5_9BACT|nr:hypothetical protein [Chitinophaga agrisoli]KAA2238795.1 hypothetical protein F0L74_21510 [Chitinophaga agrisoli]
MNYISHLNAFFQLQRNGSNLAAPEFCLYMALFDQWNTRRFENPFILDSNRLMTASGIQSDNTYRKYLKALQEKGYITYTPGPNFAWVTMRPLMPAAPDAGTPQLMGRQTNHLPMMQRAIRALIPSRT